MKTPSRRIHFVLVPGFAGFDALGQLEYYAGVTSVFRTWRDKHGHQSTALHYFDNFPTASVVTRAERLRRYLTRRIARGEFHLKDSIALVGHSTGGLDIRRLLCDLMDDASVETAYSTDGGEGSSFNVPAETTLSMINRVTFLSVPQRGTNIADWVCAHDMGRSILVSDLRVSVALSQLPLVNKLQNWVSSRAADATDLDLFHAVEDCLREAETGGTHDPMRVAMSQEAASQLELYLRHIATDFGAIKDLTSQSVDGTTESPAHYSFEQREEEKQRWENHNIETRSYATVGTCPFSFDSSGPVPVWDLSKPWTYPECTSHAGSASETDITYRTCYRACAGGPFAFPTDDPTFLPRATYLDSSLERQIEVWDNDGIVNTASMLWPHGVETRLVNGDHMDIVGHYRRTVDHSPDDGREYDAYDLLRSGTPFDETFGRVWNDIFDFCSS